jgi:DNA replication protein DnaC
MSSRLREENTINIKIKPIDKMVEEMYPDRKEHMKDNTPEEYATKFNRLLDEKIPPRFYGSEITDDKIKEFFEKNEFSYPYGKGLYVYGGCGVGKTRNLYGIYRTILANMKGNVPLEFTNITEFFSDLKQTFDDVSSESEIVKTISTNKVLFIDDLGVEKLSEWGIEATYRLLNHRYEWLKPTFISSNLSIKEMAERLGDRMTSRIVEMCDVIKIDGEDKRVKRK